MRLGQSLYKITFKKNKSIWEIILAIAMVTAMISVFTGMAVSVSKAFTAYNVKGLDYDVAFYKLDREMAENLSEDFKQLEGYKYSYFRTDEVYAYISPDVNNGLSITGVEGDYLEIYDVVMLEGRLPEKSNEIIITYDPNSPISEYIELGKNIELVCFDEKYADIQGASRSFEVVGIFKWNAGNYSLETSAFTTVEGMETLLGVRENSYSTVVCTDASNAKQLQTAWERISEMASKYGMDALMNLQPNQAKMELFAGKVGVGGALSVTFYALAVLIAGAALFMIFNMITVTTNERIRTYGFLRSVGLSQKEILKNFINIIMGVTLIGSTVGVLLGYCLNQTVGRFLTRQLVKGINDDAIKSMVLYDGILAYAEAVLLVFVAVVIANVLIWIRIKKYSITEELKYGDSVLNENEKYENVKRIRSEKNVIKLVGGRNIKRNKIISRCMYFNFFLVSLVLSVVIITFVNINFNEFTTMKKALFCDYEVYFDTIKEYKIDEAKMDVVKKDFGEKKVHGILENYEFLAVGSEEYAHKQEEVLKEAGVASMQELPREYYTTLNEFSGVGIYIADDGVIEELINGSGLKGFDVSAPLIFTEEDRVDTVTIYDRSDKKYELKTSGVIPNNYLKDYGYTGKHNLIMNWPAAMQYLGIQKEYTGMLVSSDLTETEMQTALNKISEEINMPIYFFVSDNGVNEVVNQGLMIMYIALYIVSCLFIVSIVNVVCIMRVAVKQRKREYGMFMALGMTIKETILLISYEARALCIRAMIIALPLGGVVAFLLLENMEKEVSLMKLAIGVFVTILSTYGVIYVVTYWIGKKLMKTNIKANLEVE